ncbi:cytochrome c oxidase assembly protein PET191-domain-containing protein [Lineolata rhizophorae]|uniref:Cytochrome c oxidase assembly protein PET191-domain-containing protein n=1 Tax=Lineolata rhizophorae TaxID=578093 RepID=A0A6A6NQG2_9PEZI|nr:cytochrome c oxidase assembly protein PET191-domain-containing protein [Lineolata rhizophorae]
MPSSCNDIRAALATCLQESDCVMVNRHPARDCIRPPLNETLPTQCQQLQRGLAECKRGMIDMRKRFRGNKPISMTTDKDGSAGKGMLYAGRPVFGEEERKRAEQMEKEHQERVERGEVR